MSTLRQTTTGFELVDTDGQVVQTGALSALVAAVEQPASMHWRGVVTMEETTTGDGRGADSGAWSWETPFPLKWQREGGSHEGATVIGTVWEVDRVEGGRIIGRGTFDLGSHEGREAARHVGEGLTSDVSIEPDSIDVELRVAAEVAQDWLGGSEEGEEPADLPTDDEGRVIFGEFAHDDVLEIVTAGRIRTLALVTTAAYDEATIELDGVTVEELLGTDDEPSELVAAATQDRTDALHYVVASGGPTPLPAAECFDDPALDGPTPVTVTDDGRVFGHLATWGTCHIGRQDSCLTPPPSESSYAYFRTGATRARCSTGCDGDVRTIPTGTITMDTGHASLAASHRTATAHYDDTGYAVADVACGEDEHGIWIAGTLRPGVDDDDRRALEGSSLSGDWRRIGGRLELVATLAVNVPGFPIPRSVAASGTVAHEARPRASVVEDEPVALVAAGMVTPRTRELAASTLPAEVVEWMRRVDRRLARQAAQQLRADVHARPVTPRHVDVDALRARVHSP